MTGFISKVLRKPSERTQLEATLTGIVIFLIASVCTCIYMIAYSNLGFSWKFLTAWGEVGLLLLMLPSLILTYAQLYALKLSVGAYPPDFKMFMKMNEAEAMIAELKDLIEKCKAELVINPNNVPLLNPAQEVIEVNEQEPIKKEVDE